MTGSRSPIPAGELGQVRIRNADRKAWMNLRLVKRDAPADLVIALRGDVAGRDFASAHALTWQGWAPFARILSSAHQRDCGLAVQMRFFGEAIVELSHRNDLGPAIVDETNGEIQYTSALGTSYLIRKRYLSETAGREVEAAPDLPLWTWAGLALGAGLFTCGVVYSAGSVVQSGVPADIGFDMEAEIVGVDPRLVDALAGALRTEGGMQLPAPDWA